MAKIRVFLSISKNFVITFFLIWCLIKFHIISFVFTQIPYLGKFWFLSYKQYGINQWNCRILNQLYLQEKSMNQLDFWHDDIDSRNLTVCKCLVGRVKRAAIQSNFSILKSAIFKDHPGQSVWFFAFWNWRKVKGNLKLFS